MVYTLANLNLGNPEMRGISFLAVIALKIYYDEFNYEALLKKSTIEYFLLDSKFDLQSF